MKKTIIIIFSALTNFVLAQGGFNITDHQNDVLFPGRRNGKFLFDRKDKYVMPWMLSMAVLDGEWKLENGMRVSLGAGILETHCMAGLKMWIRGYKDRSELSSNPIDLAEFLDLFSVAHGSISIPITKRLIVRPEAFVVFKDGELIKREQLVGL